MSRRMVAAGGIYFVIAAVVIAGLFVMAFRDSRTTTDRRQPLPTSSQTPARASASPAAPASKVVTYVVKAGDSLASVTAAFKHYGYTPITSWNNVVIGPNAGLIRPGLVLKFSSPS